MRLQHKVVLITGGAKGIGRATVLQAVREGAQVSWADLDTLASEELLQLVGSPHSFFPVDVQSRVLVQSWVEAALTRYGRIDVLINNAGITRDSFLVKMKDDELVRQMPEEDFDTVVAVNLKGVFHCVQAVAPQMIRQKSGVILNAASVVGLYGNLGQTNYVATKAGVMGMTKVWARELGRYGIRVNAVSPGFIATDMLNSVPEKVLADLRAKTPLGRLGTPEEVAQVYTWLASAEASFITGAVIQVDGGLVMGT